jgi:hypothetical protein
MAQHLTPVAVFTYNRPEHTRRMLATLARCGRLNECRVHVFCDGPRSPAQAEAVAASRRVVRDFASRCNSEVIERTENLGLARSITTAVTALVQTYGRIIVVEDDLVLSPDFVHFMLEALDHYEPVKAVHQVSGFFFPLKLPHTSDCFLLPMISTWGWATWRRAWDCFESQPAEAYRLLSEPQTRTRFDLDGSYPYSTMLRDRLAGKNDSWGILWWYAVFLAGGTVLFPRHSLVANGGFDGSGVHAGNNRILSRSLSFDVEDVHLPAVINFPQRVEVDVIAWRTVKHHLRRQQQQLGSSLRLRGFWNKLTRLFADRS